MRPSVFALSFSRDPGIWPVAVQAIEQYGWDEAFSAVWLLQKPAADRRDTALAGRTARRAQPPIDNFPYPDLRHDSHANAELLGRMNRSWWTASGCAAIRVRSFSRRFGCIPFRRCLLEGTGRPVRAAQKRQGCRQFDFARASRLAEASAGGRPACGQGDVHPFTEDRKL